MAWQYEKTKVMHLQCKKKCNGYTFPLCKHKGRATASFLSGWWNIMVKWQADKASGTNNYRPLKNPLSSALAEVLKPVFEKLSSLQLFARSEKCLTQNQNECLHHVIWSYLPKWEYHSPSETELGTALAVGHFNDGMYSFNSKLFQETNLKIGNANKLLWRTIDQHRMRHAAYEHSDNIKQIKEEKI